MDRALLPAATPIAIPKAAYPPGCSMRFGVEERRLLVANPHWLSLPEMSLNNLYDHTTCLAERALLSLLATVAAQREDSRPGQDFRIMVPEAAMHSRPEPKVLPPAPRPAPEPPTHSPPCTTAAVIAIWDSYPELRATGDLAPNPILALRGDQLTFRKACEYVVRMLAAGQPIDRSAGMVHQIFKAMVARRV